MKLTLNRLFSRMLSNKGYTIDQTILIVAIIAILITLVILTVGWQLLNRSSGTKAGAQLKQVEDANGQFFSDQRVWPHVALASGNTAATTMAVLVNANIPAASWASNINQTNIKNFLPGFRVTGTGTSAVVNHTFGGGGVITQQVNTYPSSAGIGGDNRLVIQFAAIPLADAREADRAIDGVENALAGRVLFSSSACLNNTAYGSASVPSSAPTGGNVFVCYAANTVD